MIIDLEKIATLIAEIADEEIAGRFGRLVEGDVDTKTGPKDFVTEADRAAEARFEKALCDLYPGAAFVGEEIAAANSSVLDHIGRDGAVWIVDPLDGTRNFVEGRKRFGSIIALVENGETRAGWIYAVPDKAFAIASKGDGAEWRGEKLGSLTPADGPLTGLRAIGNIEEPWKTRMVPQLRAEFVTESVTCSAYGYIDLARGFRDFGLYSRCHPWDHAAGALMLQEIGGRAEYFDTGAPYAPRPTQGRPLLVGGSEDRWRTVADNLAGAMRG